MFFLSITCGNPYVLYYLCIGGNRTTDRLNLGQSIDIVTTENRILGCLLVAILFVYGISV